jgi:hypothetical protein
MILHPLLAAAFALVLSADSAGGADPVVARGDSVQRPGMRRVDISCDLRAAALERNAVHGISSHPHSRTRTRTRTRFHRQTA